MSFIIGVNLSDRIYLAADTRLTRKGVFGMKYFEDNTLKIKALADNIAVAAAGNASMAAFLIKGLLGSDILSNGIFHCREHIESVLRNLVDNYFKNNEFAEVVLIFGGTDKSRPKTIDMKRYLDLVTEYQKTGKPMNMKRGIYSGLMSKPGVPNPRPILPIPDSHVFAIKIGNSGIIFEDVGWGDYVAHGGGLTKEHLPDVFLGELEVAANAGQTAHDKMWLALSVKAVAESFEAHTVGGSVTSFLIDGQGIGILLGGVGRKNLTTGEVEHYFSYIKEEGGKLYRVIGENKSFELVSFIELENKKSVRCTL
jgi:hypothetical protein